MSSPDPLTPDPASVARTAKTVAVVGLSPDASRTSNRIAVYLQGAGIRVVPVHPDHDEILGEPAYRSLLAIPEEVEIDIVCVFRRPEFAAEVVQDAADRRDRTEQNPVVWTQIGVSSHDAQRLAYEEAIPYVADRCLMVDHAALSQA